MAAVSGTPTSPTDRAAEFTGKWRARWPEWGIGMVFVPVAERDLVSAWYALLQEFTDAAWTGEDATPGLAKLAWWVEELRGWAKGGRRHPLGDVLQRQAFDWSGLAAGLRELSALRDPAASVDGVSSGLAAFPAAVAAAEAALFGHAGQQPSDTGAITMDLLAEHALLHGDPQHAAALAANESAVATTRVRRMHSAFLRRRLSLLAAGRTIIPATPWRSLLLAWRAARARP